MKTTKSPSLYDDLENKSARELLEEINTEDQKVALTVRQAIPQAVFFCLPILLYFCFITFTVPLMLPLMMYTVPFCGENGISIIPAFFTVEYS